MDESLQNVHEPSELTPADVELAIARIAERDSGLARESSHVFESLTWGEGPQVLRQASVQEWLWYVVPTKYLTDEVGYEAQLADAAAVLFDELGLHRYAAICRSDTTREVHAAFDESNQAGRKALHNAMGASGIAPPDLDDFTWSDVMGLAEATARSAVEDALEEAIGSGSLVLGGRGWRGRQIEITAATLDEDHPTEPGQSWRTSVTTERIEQWVEAADRRSPGLGRLRATMANRLLRPIDPPVDAATTMTPMTWFLSFFAQEQPLTQAGYLSPKVVRQLHSEVPSDDKFPTVQPPRSELDAPVIHRLRAWSQAAGALRKHKNVLRRTKRGSLAAADPIEAWRLLVSNIGGDDWERFVAETCALVMLDREGAVGTGELCTVVADMAAELGWATTDHGERRPPDEHGVAQAFRAVWSILEMFDGIVESGDWRDRRVELTEGGRAMMLAALQTSATAPSGGPW